MNLKEGGIPWIGKIPEHWEVTTIRSCFDEYDARCEDERYPLLSVTQEQGIILQENMTAKKDVSNDDKRNYKIVPLGGIAYNKMRMWQGAVGLNEIRAGIVSPAYIVAIPKQHASSKFAFHLFKTPSMMGEFGRYSYGLCSDMNTLRYEDFQNIIIPLPPLEEQKKIADFLDTKTRQIEEFIDKKQKLITLLEEKKQTLINQCVTQGLDPSTPLKDSGVEWIGKIPTHWEVRRLASFGSFSKGGNISRGDLSESGNSVILYGDIYTKYEIKTSNLKSKVAKDLESLAPSIYKGDILLAGSGETKEDIGKTVVYQGDEKAFAGGDVIILRQVENDSLFLSYSLNSQYAKAFKAVESKGEIIVHIYASNLRELKIPIPPSEEQKAIAEYLDTQITKIDLAISKIKSQINLIKEYKTTLISEAVCGRVEKF